MERSIMEVHEMFLDLAVLVESQGAMINNIEDNVLKTTDYVRTANVDLTAAAEHNRSPSRVYSHASLERVPRDYCRPLKIRCILPITKSFIEMQMSCLITNISGCVKAVCHCVTLSVIPSSIFIF